MAEETEVSAKLVLDDHASEALSKVKEGFAHVGEKVHEVTSEIAGMAKQALAVAAGFQLSGVIDSLKELGHEVISASSGAEQQQKALAGLIAMTDKTGMSFEKTMANAVELHDDLEQIGIAAGTSTDQVIGAFEMIAQRSQKSTEEVKELTAEMTQAGRALPGGVETLAAAYRDLETGIVRPRNALVQLIKQTGTAQGTMKDIAKGLTAELQSGHMDKVFDLAQVAIGKMSEKMKAAPPTFKEVVTSLKDIRENVFEAMGAPILATLVPQLKSLKDHLVDNRMAIEEFAQAAAVKVGAWVTWSAGKIRDGFYYLQNHADEIREALEKGAQLLKDAFAFVLAHKEQIAMAFGAKALLGVSGAVGGAFGKEGGGGALLKGLGGAAGQIMSPGGFEAMAAAAPELAVALPIVAATAFGLAGIFRVLNDDTNALHGTAEALVEGIKTDLEGVWKELNVEMTGLVPMFKEAADILGTFWLANMRAGAAELKFFLQAVNALNEPITKMAQYIAEILHLKPLPTGSEAMAERAGRDFGQERGDQLAPLKGSVAEAAKAALKNATLVANFNGTTINVKQDFRDQDPDRIAVIFKNDIAKNATNRIGARTGGPFT